MLSAEIDKETLAYFSVGQIARIVRFLQDSHAHLSSSSDVKSLSLFFFPTSPSLSGSLDYVRRSHGSDDFERGCVIFGNLFGAMHSVLIFAQYFTSQAPSARSISSSRTKSPSSSQTVIKINLSSPPLRVYSPIDPDSAARTNFNRYDRFESINDVARGGKFRSRHFFHIFFHTHFQFQILVLAPHRPPMLMGVSSKMTVAEVLSMFKVIVSASMRFS